MAWWCFPTLQQKLGSWVRRGRRVLGLDSPKKDQIPEVRIEPPKEFMVPSSGQGSVRRPSPSPPPPGGLQADQDGDSRSIASSSYHADSDILTLNQNNKTMSEAGDQDSDFISHKDTGQESTLREKLCEVRIEAPQNSHRYFIPTDDLKLLVTPDSISMELEERGKSEDVARSTTGNIMNSAPKLFAILVYLRHGELILDFLEEGIDDTHLPFIRSDQTPGARDYKLCSRCNPGQPLNCMERWDRDLVDEFGRDQWCMLAPVFEYHDEIEHYDLHDNCVLPWVEDEERGDSAMVGGYGSVSKIAIHPAHQLIVGNANQISLSQFVAIKRLHSKNESNFKEEVAMFKKLKKRKHAHLVNLLATYRYKSHFYLIFPYAHCNLRQYWQHTPNPDFTQATIFWMLQECRGVSSALLMVHEARSTGEFAVSAIESSGSGVVSSHSEDENQTRIYGRHGDIKAENILWFEKNDDSPGVLVVADFGLMAFHTKDTRSDVPAKHITGSPSYEPPECFLLHSKISRAFDIWSLGCLYLEFVTWLVCGWKHLQRFPKVREMRGPPAPEFLDDTFFTINESENRAVVRQSVIDWIADLHEMPRASTFVHEFLDIISSRLLLVIPGERIRIGQLNAELSDMLKRASNDPLYLTDPKPLPQRAQQPHPQSLAAFHRNGDIISPATQEGVSLPKQLSGILDSEAPRN